jgi:hypothetical protein
MIRNKLTPAKKFALSLLLLPAVTFCHAQRIDIFGGLNSSSFNHKIAGSSQKNSGNFNFHMGLGVFVPFHPKEYKQSNEAGGIFPRLQYVSKGTSRATIISSTSADIKVRYLQLNVPVSYVSGSYGIGIGPYAAYAVSGWKKDRVGSAGKQNIHFGSDLNRLDYGVSIDFEFSLFKLQYDLGIANIGTGINTVKTRNFGIGIRIPLADASN